MPITQEMINETMKPLGGESPHKDWQEKIDGTPFYVRFQIGPDYEHAYLCVDDGEPDMHDIGTFYSHQTARDFVATMRSL